MEEDIDYRELIYKLDKLLLRNNSFTQEEREIIVEDLSEKWIKLGLLI